MDAGLPPVAFLLRDAGTGGAERSSLRLANALARCGLPVSALFLHARGPMFASLAPEVRVVDLHGSFLRLLNEVRRGKFGFLLPVYTAMRALLTKVILRGPLQVILSQRSMFTMERGPLQTRLRTLRYRLLAPRASACVCISRGVADEMRSLGFLPPEKIHVIYNAVVTPELLDQIRAAAKAPAPHPWLEGGQPPVVLGAGRLGDQKDFSTLLRAFARLAQRRPEVRLIVLGEGKERPLLERRIAEMGLSGRAALPGYDPNPYAWIARASVFAISSRWEGFGNVAAEALACGCSVVSTDCPSGPGEILDHGKYGWLVPVGDDEAMADALDDALAHPMPVSLLKERASYFSEDRAAEGWLALMRSLSQ